MKGIISVKRLRFSGLNRKSSLVFKRAKLLSAVVLVVGISYAQGNMPQNSGREKLSGEELIQKGLERMKEKLELTEEQSAQIKTVMEKHHEEMKDEREAFRARMKAHFEEMNEKREALNEEIKTSLSEEQKEIFEQIEQRRKERLKKGIKQRRDNRDGHRRRPMLNDKKGQ